MRFRVLSETLWNRCIEMPQNAIHKIDIEKIINVINYKRLDPLNLSLIHISEPTRQEAISYAVFCLKNIGTYQVCGEYRPWTADIRDEILMQL